MRDVVRFGVNNFPMLESSSLKEWFLGNITDLVVVAMVFFESSLPYVCSSSFIIIVVIINISRKSN
jgi:hypothetical protein